MIKNKAAFTISKEINRLYRENYIKKNKNKQAMKFCCLADSFKGAFPGVLAVLSVFFLTNDRFKRAFFQISTGQDRTVQTETVKHAVYQQIKNQKLTKILNKYNKVNTFQVNSRPSSQRIREIVCPLLSHVTRGERLRLTVYFYVK